MFKRIFYLVLPILIVSLLPATGCGQSTGQSEIVIKAKKAGYLGVEVQDIDNKLRDKKDLKIEYGAYVVNVVEESPADEAGIKEGDVIIGFNGKRIDDGEDLTVAVRKVKPKTEVKVEVIRKGEKIDITAVIGKVKGLRDAFAFSFDDDAVNLQRSFKNLKLPKVYTKLSVSKMSEMSGIQVQSLTKQLGEYFGAPRGKGVLVSSVKKGSNADQAGFKAGDVIIKVNNNSVDDVDEFQEEYSEREEGEVPFEVIRGGKSVKLTMKVEPEEIEEEEDDDWSIYNRLTLPDPPHIEIIQPTKARMHTLQGRLINLRYNLQDKLRTLKERIRHYLRDM